MGRLAHIIQGSTTVPPAPALAPALPNPLTHILQQALSRGVALLRSMLPGRPHITIKLGFGIFFRNGGVVENEVELGEVPESPESAEIGAVMHALQNVEGLPAVPAPLMSSLHGILERHAQ